MRLLLALLSLTLLAPAAVAEDNIWSAVVMASNAARPSEPPPALRPFAGRLRRVFGYNQYEIVGTAMETIDEEEENWIVPGPHFSFSVRARRATSRETRGGYLFNLQLFQDKRLLVESTARLAPGSPLFIRGPLCARGQIILVLQVQP